MRLLLLAQTPPPLHGQSRMVQAAVEGLPARGIEVRHVNLALSGDSDSIGRWQASKLVRALRCVATARRELRQGGYDALYYVPAPGKRIAIWRDALVLGLLRPYCPRLVLHWHASGLGAWLQDKPAPCLKVLARRALAQADLSLVLTDSLRADAAVLQPRAIQVLSNGIEDPFPDFFPLRPARQGQALRLFYLGLCSEEKGVFLLIEAFRRFSAISGNVELVLSGPAADAWTAARLREACAQGGSRVFWTGFVSGSRLESLWAAADVFCYPSTYPHEAQPLVVLEAMARDVPVAAVAWRGVGETLPPGSRLAAPGSIESFAQTLSAVLAAPPAKGVLRQRFLELFTLKQHLDALAVSLSGLGTGDVAAAKARSA